MYWKITKDHIWREGDGFPSREGMVYGTFDPPPNLLEVRLIDDDRECYYEGVADDEALEHFWSWGMHDAGTTILQVLNGKGEWEDTIA